MAFKPRGQREGSGNSGEYVQRNYPVPNKGPRRARVSLIVDLGVQEREDFDIGKPTQKPQKPAPMVAIFADLVNDTVDYGGEIGKAHYRLLLNGTFKGVLKGIPFQPTPPKDGDGNTIKGKQWGLHDNSLITKLAKAVEKPEVQYDMDLEALLGLQFMADVDVNEVASGKDDADGNEIIYKNVNFKSSAKVAPVLKSTGEQDEDGNDIEVEEMPVFNKLKMEPMCITFDNATAESVQFIRANIIKQIKQAQDYAGSNMQKAIEAFEASKGDSSEDSKPAEGKTAPAKAKAAPKPAKEKAPVEQDPNDDVPF